MIPRIEFEECYQTALRMGPCHQPVAKLKLVGLQWLAAKQEGVVKWVRWLLLDVKAPCSIPATPGPLSHLGAICLLQSFS